MTFQEKNGVDLEKLENSKLCRFTQHEETESTEVKIFCYSPEIGERGNIREVQSNSHNVKR